MSGKPRAVSGAAATPASSALSQIRQRRERTLTMIVREAIAGMIARSELRAGDRINESELASRLEVSRGPVREACRSLEEAGLLVSVVNQGVFVREMSIDDARQLYEVRGALSGLIGRLAAQRVSAVQLTALRDAVDRMAQAAQAGDVAAYYPLNLEFHQQLLQAADNRLLADMYLATVNQTHLFRQRGLVQPGSLADSHQEHQQIVQALASGDAALSERLLTAHVAGGWERLARAVAAT